MMASHGLQIKKPQKIRQSHHFKDADARHRIFINILILETWGNEEIQTKPSSKQDRESICILEQRQQVSRMAGKIGFK